MQDQPLPDYDAPEIITYTEEDILEALGPAQTTYGDEPLFF